MLDGVSLQINGVPAPLAYAGQRQINAQLPFETQPGVALAVVNVGGTNVAAGFVRVLPIDFKNGTVFEQIDKKGMKWTIYGGDAFPAAAALKGISLSDVRSYEDFAKDVRTCSCSA